MPTVNYIWQQLCVFRYYQPAPTPDNRNGKEKTYIRYRMTIPRRVGLCGLFSWRKRSTSLYPSKMLFGKRMLVLFRAPTRRRRSHGDVTRAPRHWIYQSYEPTYKNKSGTLNSHGLKCVYQWNNRSINFQSRYYAHEAPSTLWSEKALKYYVYMYLGIIVLKLYI